MNSSQIKDFKGKAKLEGGRKGYFKAEKAQIVKAKTGINDSAKN